MSSYVVMERPGSGDGSETRFVRDAFTLLGFLLPHVWLLWRRLWIEALVLIAVTLVIAAASQLAWFAAIAGLISLLASLVIGLEGSALELWALRRRGFVEAGVVDAADAAEAEIRWFHDHPAMGAPPPAFRRAAVPLPALTGTPALSGTFMGLFDYPGDR